MSCFVVKPNDMSIVRKYLDENKISYQHDEDIIFANISEIPEGLAKIAHVYDPVRCIDGKWFFQIEGDEAFGPVEDEGAARSGFVGYISWSGEFVNNGH